VAFISQFILVQPLFKGSVYWRAAFITLGSTNPITQVPANFPSNATKHTYVIIWAWGSHACETSPLRLTAKRQSRVSETGGEDPFTDVEEAEDELEESGNVLNTC